jgi:MoaA/NifB/PqqE/SkfB family radical SAM enzyme
MVVRRALGRARALRVIPDALLAVDAPRARPVHMHLEHTTVCDHVCSTCIRAERIDGEVHMPVDEAIAHIDAIGPKFLSLNGIGEPLLHPRWDDIVRHAIEAHGASVGFATTGTHFEAQAERICESGVGLVKVSFHGARPKTFSRLASGRKLDVVEGGIAALLLAKKRLGKGPEIRLNYVVSDQSFTELEEAVRVAARLGVSAVYFKGALVTAGRNSGLAGEHPIAGLHASVEAAVSLAKHHKIDTNLARWQREIARVGDVPPEERPPPPGRCLIPWISVFVRIDGTLLPCCNCTWHPDEGQMGRVGHDGTFDELWRGEAFRKLRSEMRHGTYSLTICQDCPDPVTAPQFAESALHKLWPGFLSG